MTEEQFLPLAYTHPLSGNPIQVTAPSNIALVKYWGKYNVQLPKNPSISFTLNHCRTTTQLRYKRRERATDKAFDFSVFLDDRRVPGFEPKIEQFLCRAEKYIPFIKDYTFRIDTSNSFPHSSGIASSASGMSALALGLMAMEHELRPAMSVEFVRQKASFLARLGSGSACRSIDGPVIIWGEHAAVEQSSNLLGSKYQGLIHPIFHHYQDTILLVDRGEKQVSSTVGHNLMNNHPYAPGRFEQANSRIMELLDIFKTGDINAFIQLVESEALTLHAMMMTSNPYFILMKPNTLKIIDKIWDFRRATDIPLCFTLDAGANVHVLYPEENKERVLQFIREELIIFCVEEGYICDQVGTGAHLMESS